MLWMEWVKRTMCGYRGVWHCKTLLWEKKRKSWIVGLWKAVTWRAGAGAAGRFGLRQHGGLNRGKGQREAGTDIREDVQCRPVQARDTEESHTQCRSSPQQPGESRLKASTRETPSVQCLELRLAAPSLHRSLGKFPSHFHPQLCEPGLVNPPSTATLTWCGRRWDAPEESSRAADYTGQETDLPVTESLRCGTLSTKTLSAALKFRVLYTYKLCVRESRVCESFPQTYSKMVQTQVCLRKLQSLPPWVPQPATPTYFSTRGELV